MKEVTIKYMYWNPGDKVPDTLPKDCEWQSSSLGSWHKERDVTGWRHHTRRWPIPVEYVYWHPGYDIPDRVPKGCEIELACGVWAADSTDPVHWSRVSRRWPRPAAEPGQATPFDIPDGWEQVKDGCIKSGDLVRAGVPQLEKPVWWYSLVLRRKL